MENIKKTSMIVDSIIDICDSVPDTFEIDALGLNIEGYQNYLTFDKEVILKRQSVFKDIISSDVLREKYAGLLSKIDQLEEFIKSYGSPDSTEEIIYSIIEIRSFCEVINYISGELVPLIDDGTQNVQRYYRMDREHRQGFEVYPLCNSRSEHRFHDAGH